MSVYNYWNDITIEKQKAFWIENEQDPKLQRFLREDTNLERCFQDALKFAEHFGGIRGKVLDVGAGVAWTSAIVSRDSGVDKITAIDFSKHRLEQIAPMVFKQYSGRIDKIEFIVGDFKDHEWPTASFDIVIFCQSLYHFPDLRGVLKKIQRILCPGGIVIVACERIFVDMGHPFLSLNFYKRNWGRLWGKRADSSGNYFRGDNEYCQAIKGAGLDYQFQALDYPVYKGGPFWSAGNYFGIKYER